jgi:hypothetical protein
MPLYLSISNMHDYLDINVFKFTSMQRVHRTHIPGFHNAVGWVTVQQ